MAGALLWWFSMINSFLPERSPTLNSWKGITAWETKPREGLEAHPAEGLSLTSSRLNVSVGTLDTAVVMDVPSNNWTQKWPIFLTSRDLPWKENRNSTDGAAFSNPCGCHEISSFPLSRPQRLPLQLFISSLKG